MDDGAAVTVLIPKLACAIGALYFGLSVPGVIVLTNAGMVVNYVEAGRTVRAASRRKS
jgi:hypothetical protein